MKNKKVTQVFAGLMVTALVMTGTVIPPTTATAATKSVTIKTQKQLDAALKNPKVTTIVIKTAKGTTFKIKTGDYDKKNLVINAPKATVNNYGNFKKIAIQDGKTVYERGVENNIAVSDKNSLKLYAGKQSKDTDITITSKGAKIAIVNSGDIDAINVKGKSTVSVGGSAKGVPTITNNASGSKIVTAMDAAVVLNKSANLTVKSGATLESLTMKANSTVKVSAGATVGQLVIDKADATVNLKIDGIVDKVVVEQKATVNVSGATSSTIAVENNAAGSEINSAVKTDVSLNADAKISLGKGAEGSTVKIESADVKADVENQTSDKVTITDSTGKDATIDSGKTSEDAKPSTGDTNKDQPSGGSTGGGSSWNGGSGSGNGNENGGGEVQKKNFAATPAVEAKTGKVSVTMTKVDGVKFYVDGTETEFTYESEAYTATLTEEGKHSIKISADGYNDYTFDAVYDKTAPVITVEENISSADVYVSDAPTWNYASATVTDAVDDTVKVVITMKDKDSNPVADVTAARDILKQAGNTITVTYDATDASGNAATQKTVVYTSKADVAATAVEIKGTIETGNILTAAATGEGSETAGGGLTYQWQSSDTQAGTYTDISGATAATYIIPATDVGKYYKVKVTNPGGGDPVTSNATSTAVAEGTLSLDGDATYREVLANNTAPDATKLSATFINAAGQTVAVQLAFASPEAQLTESSDSVSFTATVEGYKKYEGTVSIRVKAATPTGSEVKLSTEQSSIEVGKVAFAEAYSNIQYSVDGTTWTSVTTAPIDVPTSKVISVRRTGANNEPSDSFEITVEDANIGTKKTALAAVSVESPVLVLDNETLKISGTITDADNDASLVSDYEVRVYAASDLIADGTIIGKTLVDTALTLKNEKSFSPATNYTVKVVVNPADTVKYEASEEGAGTAATNQCVVTIELQNGTATTSKRVNYNESFSEEAPTREGYSFTGWYTAATAGDKVDMITENTTVYAQWVEIQKLTASEVVSLAFPTAEGLESKAQGLSDDGDRRANVWGLTGQWDGTTLKISGDIAASTLVEKADGDGAGSLPVFLSVPLNGANGIKITTGDNNFYKCQTDNTDSLNGYKNKGETDVVDSVVYLKFGKTFATKAENTWSVSQNRTFDLQVYKEMDGASDGILVAECTFTLDFSGIKITEQD